MKLKETTYKPLIFGISGLKLTEKEKDLFTKNQVKGFILFKRNIDSEDQLSLLISELKSLYKLEPLIFIDQEGGRVARLKPPLVEKNHPPAEFFGQMYKEHKEHKSAYKQTKDNASDIMTSLKKYGIDSPCGPVADLRYKDTDLVIGDRSFGPNVDQVVYLCEAFVDGIIEAGGTPIIKHMPGHGRATCDSHLALPRVGATLDDLMKTDFEVFRQLSKNPQIKWAMTAHIVFDALDSENPVTLSSKAIKFIRESIGFKGTLITDAIEMLALHGDVGAKYLLIKKSMDHYNTSDTPLIQEYVEKLLKFEIITQDFSVQDTEIQMVYLYEKLEQSQLEFTQSLCDVAVKSLEAGCDIVLHCTGAIDEMTSICEALL